MPGTQAGIAIPGYRLAGESLLQLSADLDRVVASGAAWLRTDIVWGDIEYTQGQFDWSYPDRIVNAAHARGLKVLGIATVLPAWARPSGSSWNFGPQTVAQRAAFATFAGLAAARYAGGIQAWEIWNEMNSAQFWAPVPSPSAYTALLKAASPAIRSADPGVTVVAGGTAWAGSAPDVASTDWYRGLYAAGARPYFDAAATHPYFDFSGINTQEMARSATIRSIMDDAGDGTKPLWGTEIGAPTGGSASLSEAQQAAFLPQAFDTWANIHDHGPLFWYTLNDTDGSDREAHFGLQHLDGSIKPSFTSFQRYFGQPAADTISPAVAITSPGSNAALVGKITVSANATDNVGVAIVDFMVDGTVVATDTATPFTTFLDSASLSSGVHLLSAAARDAAGNRTVSVPVSISVGATPTTNVSSLSADVTGTGATFAVTLVTAVPINAALLVVAARDQADGNYDATLAASIVLSGTQTFAASRAMPTGVYTYRVAYLRDGAWTDLWPTNSVAIGSPPAPAGPGVTRLSATRGSRGLTVNFGLSTDGMLRVDRLNVAVRNRAGAVCDIVVGANLSLSGVQSFTASRALPQGMYAYRIAYYRQGIWTDLQPGKSVQI